ncbi:hypothetical protein TWF703_008566 [Orbilia oligospora]|uniref:Uncharacterized protein n=1 Tax=Orbilia oligospora TaxID=2813651 RepID=A0A7C8JN83_ORBOL|nr:hypothetical protein TWF703_008566 [Orbilia oligospora]
MGTADRAFEIRTSPAALFDLSFWAFSPLMVFHGIAYWLLPLALVIAPSSLTITIRRNSDGSEFLYEYHRRNLFLAYLIPGVLVFVGCLVGVINIIGSTRSYSTTLSTVIRTSRNESLDRLIQITDRNGGNPLPKRLARTKVRLASLYGTSVALDGENFAIEEDEGKLGVQRVEERDSELDNLSTIGNQDQHHGTAKLKDQPVLLAGR